MHYAALSKYRLPRIANAQTIHSAVKIQPSRGHVTPRQVRHPEVEIFLPSFKLGHRTSRSGLPGSVPLASEGVMRTSRSRVPVHNELYELRVVATGRLHFDFRTFEGVLS